MVNYCVTKPIGKVNINIPNFGYNGEKSVENNSILYLKNLDFIGTYSCDDNSELLNTYRVKLFNSNDELIEDSSVLQAAPASPLQYFSYVIKHQCDFNVNYKLVFTYETQNKYSNTLSFVFRLQESYLDEIDVNVITYENDEELIMKNITSPFQEDEEGRICYKLYSETDIYYTGKLCIRRTDESSDFKEWEDLKIINIKNQKINELEPFYDYTIESGIKYKYGVQPIKDNGSRQLLKITENPIEREFEFSFLLGEDNQQLKLMFDETINTYKINISEGKTDTIDYQFPTISRNGKIYYKTFSLSGLISFNMDESKSFMDFEHSIIDLYNKTYERKFRQKVLDFLHDGKPKLFKSSTEGNLIIRLMEINCTPNQQLDRLVYNFSANCVQIANSNINEYETYNLLKLEDSVENEGSNFYSQIGQVKIALNSGEDLIQAIYDSYDSKGQEVAPNTIKVIKNIRNLKIDFEDEPFRIKLDNDYITGYKIIYNGNNIIIYDNQYNFGSYVNLTPNKDKIIIDNEVSPINIIANFIYDYAEEPYISKEDEIISETYVKGYGQYFGSINANTSIYDEIINRYYYDDGNLFRSIEDISGIEIEAPVYSMFLIKDNNDESGENIMINDTGVLALPSDILIKDIIYLGKYNKDTDEIDNVNSNLIINYKYTLLKKYIKERSNCL